MLAAQSEEEATILRLRFYDEMPAHAVALRLNMSEGNVFKRQRRALSTLLTSSRNGKKRCAPSSKDALPNTCPRRPTRRSSAQNRPSPN
ncbi:MAG: sigma factor-like helix-turn-helix DNA-binding protein [Caldilineaceae bacterium]